MTHSLFAELPPPTGPFAGIALEQAIDQVLDYSVPARLTAAIQVGQRVRVPLGIKNRPAHGYVVRLSDTCDYPKIKPILAIEDARALVTSDLLELARWISRYYVTPLGTVLESVIPAAVKKKIGLGYNQMVRLAEDREKSQLALETISGRKRRAILARLMQLPAGGGIELMRLAEEAGTTPATVRKLARLGLIHITAEIEPPKAVAELLSSAALEADIQPNPDQQKVLDEMSARIAAGGFSINLLHGVTGSGKTEVYLQCIRQVIAGGRQAIVLVPEIALTTQTVARFLARFGRVAVLHSGLSASQRHQYWRQIRAGLADVVVGARSAIFAPTPNCGIIVVDEEHESSYKQDTAPRYHARDVAIKRAQLAGIPILLGSATPALETYWRVKGREDRGDVEHGGPSYLRLPHRVRGLAMPTVELVDMRREIRIRPGIHLISLRLESLLRSTLQQNHQAIILLNRRGYSNFVYCSSCNEAIKCNYCDATVTYHRSADAHATSARFADGLHTGQLHCHYCLAVTRLPEKCPLCGKKLSLFGLGTQRVEEELAKKLPDLKFARVDSDSMRSSRDYESLLARFAQGQIQVMLGTQMIAKGLDYPNVTLVGVISGDTALALPDFRAGERTFQLITQVAGRAGRGDSAGRVVLQTFQPDDATIRAALRQDYAAFAEMELGHRRQLALPPFARLVRIILRDQNEGKLHQLGEKIAADLAAAAAGQGSVMTLRGPMPCPIARIGGYFRNQIVMSAAAAETLQRILAAVRGKGDLTKADRVAVDVDPVSLL